MFSIPPGLPRTVTIVHASFASISTLLFFSRIYTRRWIMKKFGFDDIITFGAWLAALSEFVLELYEAKNGTGSSISQLSTEHIIRYFRLLPFLQIAYFLAIGLGRLSILAFVSKIHKEKENLRPFLIAFLAVMGLVTVVFPFALFFQCSPTSDLWNRGPNSQCYEFWQQRMVLLVHGSLGILFDLALLLAPIVLLRSRSPSLGSRIGFALLYSLGIIAMTAGIVRIYYLQRPRLQADQTLDSTPISILAATSIHSTLWLSNLLAIQPLFHNILFHMKLRSEPYQPYRPTNLPNAPNNGFGYTSRVASYITSYVNSYAPNSRHSMFLSGESGSYGDRAHTQQTHHSASSWSAGSNFLIIERPDDDRRADVREDEIIKTTEVEVGYERRPDGEIVDERFERERVGGERRHVRYGSGKSEDMRHYDWLAV